MKNFNIMVISSLIIFNTAPAFADGTIQFQGTVAEEVSLTVNDDAVTDLDLENATPIERAIGSTAEISNRLDGFKILAFSNNAGTLQHTTSPNASYEVAYTITYDGVEKDLTGSTSASKVELRHVDTQVAKWSKSNIPVTIKYTGNPNLPAGTYSDTINLSIIAD